MRVIQILLLFLILFGMKSLSAQVFESESFLIKIDWRCPEGWVTCDEVKMDFTEKKTGSKWVETGESMHRTGKDGETPTRFLGYQCFHRGLQFAIYVDGSIAIRDKEKNLILEEKGTLDWPSDEVEPTD